MGNSAARHPGILASLFDAYPDALIVSDRTGHIVLANQLASDLFGYAVGELIGKHIETLVPDPVRARHSDYRKAYFKAPRTRPMGTDTELVARRKDGTEVMVSAAQVPGSEWVVAVGQPAAALRDEVRQSMLVVLVAGGICACLGIGLAVLVARQLGAQMRGLVNASLQPGSPGAAPASQVAAADVGRSGLSAVGRVGVCP